MTDIEPTPVAGDGAGSQGEGATSVDRLLSSPLRWVVLSIGAAVFAMTVAAIATIGAGTAYVGEAVVTFDQPGVTFSESKGLEAFQMFGAITPTLAERARSDEHVRAVAEAIGTSEDIRATRGRISSVVLPDTIAIRLRVAHENEDAAAAGVQALVSSFLSDIEDLPDDEVPAITADVLRSPTTFDNRPDVLRSVLIAGLIGLLLGVVAAAVLERS